MNKQLVIGGGVLAVLFLMFGKKAKADPVEVDAFGNAGGYNGVSETAPKTASSGDALMTNINNGQSLFTGITDGLGSLAMGIAAFEFITNLTKPLLLPSATRANINDPKAAYGILTDSGIPKAYALAFVNNSELDLNAPLWDAYRRLNDYQNADGTFSLPPVYLQRGPQPRTIWERVPKDGVAPGDGWEVAILPDGREFNNKGVEVPRNAWVKSILS